MSENLRSYPGLPQHLRAWPVLPEAAVAPRCPHGVETSQTKLDRSV